MDMNDWWSFEPGKATGVFSDIVAQLTEKAYMELGEVLDKLKTKSSRNISPYTILSVTPNATQEEVRQAYYEKVKIYHPDKGGTDAQMKIINQSYEMIKHIRGWK